MNEKEKKPVVQKIYTKVDESGYDVERKRAQKISFAKFQELLQRNVTKTVSKTYTQYTRDLLDQYVQSPLNNIDNIREVSRFLTRVSMLYKQMISYFSTMPLYTYNITTLADYTKDFDPDKQLKNYEKVLKVFHHFNMAKELQNVVSNTIRDGMYVGWMNGEDENGIFLMQNYKLILNKIPLLDSENVDDFAISLELVNQFDSIIKEILPDLVGYGTVPYQEDAQVIDFEKSTSASDTDSLNKAMNNLFANAGINKLIVSSGDSSNANGIKYSNANDLGKISVYIRRIESWLNYWIKNHITDGVYLQIFDQTQYNKDDFISQKKDASSFGIGKMDYMCALGDDPYVAYNKLRFDALVLNVNQYAIPFSTSYTQSSDTGGRPSIPEEDLSPEGQATRDSGKNDDKGNK